MTRSTSGATDQSQKDIRDYCCQLSDHAAIASQSLSTVSGASRTKALHAVAGHIEEAASSIIRANQLDLDEGETQGLSSPLLARLTLDDQSLAKMAASVRQIAEQVDPIGQLSEGYRRPNGLRIDKRRVPIGVLLFIYESRPNVTSDAAALCIKSSNAVILRGGKEARHSNTAIAKCIRTGLTDSGLNTDVVQFVETPDRTAVGELLRMEGKIDLAIPRGGESLIKAVVQQAHIPVIKHYTGNCHVYIAAPCDEQMALDICVNAKTQNPAVCNAAETLLFDQNHLENGVLERICQAMADRDVEIRGDQETCKAFAGAKPATEEDWHAEYLDLVVAVKTVSNLDGAVHHINHYGSKHTDTIITTSVQLADQFTEQIDSANVMVNCSTRFSDGGEYGLGAEIGISTDKLHARGPMGAADLTTYKWIVRGDGQIRQ